MPYAIAPVTIGKEVGSRAIEEGWPLAAGEAFTVDADPAGMVLAEDGISLRAPAQAELDAEALERTKAMKTAELEAAFVRGQQRAVRHDVGSGEHWWRGGSDSAQLIVLAVEQAEFEGVSQVGLYPASTNTAVPLTIGDARQVAAAIGVQYRADLATLKSLKQVLRDAGSVQAIDAIAIPEQWRA